MKKIIALLLALAMLLSLAACGGSAEEDPNAGKYIGISAAVGGFSLPMSDIYPGETWIELKSGGKGDIMLDGDSYGLKWTLEGEAITITLEGVDSIGTLKDGVITVDLMDMGCVMEFLLEGAEPPVPTVTYQDAGYYEFIRIENEDPESAISEEDMAIAKSAGLTMYLELRSDGTGTMYIEEEMPVTWQDGKITYVEDGLSVSYTMENGEMTLDMLGSVMVLRKGTVGTLTMESAGFTSFMEVGTPYAYDTATSDDDTILTTGEATVTSYEIFDSAQGYPAKEGYEWRVVKMEVRFYDENTSKYGCQTSATLDDYYNSKLHSDTFKQEDKTDQYSLYSYHINHDGQETEGFCYYSASWGDWYTGKAGNDEIIRYIQWDFLVPVGYDGSVAVLRDSRTQWPDGAYITDLDPANFLLFRAD